MKNQWFFRESSHNQGASPGIKARARGLRKRMTDSEKILWTKLRNRKINGLHFRRQHPFGIYILDFYSYSAGLVIEVDGEIHDFTKDYDLDRTKYLESCGLKIIRFTNLEIEEDLPTVMEIIKSHSLSPLGETGKGVNIKQNEKV